MIKLVNKQLVILKTNKNRSKSTFVCLLHIAVRRVMSISSLAASLLNTSTKYVHTII